jgi:hypothetical protein
MKLSINENTLIAIGNAIREKTGKTEPIAPSAMPQEIASIQVGGGGGEVEPIVLTGDQKYGCSGVIASTYINLFGNTVSTENIMATNNMFQYSTLERIPFAINMNKDSYRNMNSMFYNCINLKEAPVINNAYPENCQSMFYECRMLREFPEDFGSNWNWSRMNSYSSANFSSFFSYCRSLRKLPKSIVNNLWGLQSSSYAPTYRGFYSCYVLDELRDFPIQQATLKSNSFTDVINYCHHLKDFTFAVNEDGTPKTANWKSQTIDLTYEVGYSVNNLSVFLDYNSGITADKQVKDDTTYQALKNDPDWFSTDINYSRYNHTSAVNTINSLPDCSAYGTNTIKFKGAAGALTDGGAINTLTEEEIAVAAVKGWTVTLS